MNEVRENKDEPEPKDISEAVLEIFNGNNKYKNAEIREYLRSLRSEPELKITMPYIDLNHAKQAKAFLEDALGKNQRRSAAIRATKSQMQEAANIFNSGVEQIEIDEQGNEVKKEQ